MIRKSIFILLFFSLIQATGITVDEGRSLTFKVENNISKFLNTKKDVAYINKQEGRTFFVKGLKPGITYLHYWDESSKHYIKKVSVKYVREARSKKGQSERGDQLYGLYFKYDPEQIYAVNRRLTEHKVNYFTSLAGYRLNLLIKAQNIEKKKDYNIEELHTFRALLTKPGQYLVLGDDTVKYSDLIVPYLSYQGLRFNTKINFLSKAYDIDTFYGYEVGKLWGSSVRNDAAVREKEVTYQGFKVGTVIQKHYFNFLYAAKSVKYSKYNDYFAGENEQTNVLGLNVVYAYSTNIIFDFDIANSNFKRESTKSNANATQLKMDYSDKNASLIVKYKDIAPSFQSLGNYFNHLGARGFFVYGRYRYHTILGINGNYQRYDQTYDNSFSGNINENYLAERLRLKFTFFNVPYTVPSITTRRYLGAFSLLEGYTINIDQIDILKRWLTSYLEYDHMNMSYNRDVISEGTRTVSTIGLRSRPFKMLGLRLEHVSEEEIYKGAADSNPRGYNFIVSYGSFTLPKTEITGNLSYWFQSRLNSQETIDKNRNSLRLSLRENKSTELYWYLNFIYTKENSLKYEWQERVGYFYNDDLVQSEISGGLVYYF